jgi:large subunit ribosomal protein L22
MSVKYSFKGYNKDNMARAIGGALPISTKQSIEICNFIRHKSVKQAKKLLQAVVEHKSAIPFRRFKSDIGHKTKLGPGRFPEKASKEFIKLIKSVEANAQFKGLAESELIITHISAQKASRPWHFARKRGRKMKRTNIEIVVTEKREKKVLKNNKEKKNNKISINKDLSEK